MENSELHELLSWYDRQSLQNLVDRRFKLSDLEPRLKKLSQDFELSVLGSSHESRPIYKTVVGRGATKILIWTQMHGNESTGTKAVLDMFTWIEEPGELAELRDELLSNCTICVIPMLNPDGAERYTRLDSRGIDLNRDVLDKKAPESRVLQEVLKEFDPDYCFNMHDQRTIFSVGTPAQPATLSFLAPSEDKERTVTEGRKRTMDVIAAMYRGVKEVVGNRIGRYTDEFYPTATGDNFQKMGYPTILIESGHFPGDYSRQQTRKFTFLALLTGIKHILKGEKENYHTYFEIPENEKHYLDRIVKNVKVNGNRVDLGIYFKEELVGGRVEFVPTLDRLEDLTHFAADEIIPGDHLSFSSREDAEKWLSIEFI